MKPKLLLTLIALATLITLSLARAQGAYTPESPTTGTTTLVSVDSDGIQGDAPSGTYGLSISSYGRYVVFNSNASNLVPDDTNGMQDDIFLHDTQTGQTTLVSTDSNGTQGNLNSLNPAISDDGRYVAFQSYADNLVPGDTNGLYDFFVHDRQTGITTRVSVAADGTQGSGDVYPHLLAISSEGRVAFESEADNLVPDDTNGEVDIFVHDIRNGLTTRVSVASDGTQGNSNSFAPAISTNGRYVAFVSGANNLVPGDTNYAADIFLHDTLTGVTTHVSVASDGTQGNYGSSGVDVSDNGRFVTFGSYADNLVPGDTNGRSDIFKHDTLYSTTSRVSVASDGTQGNSASKSPAISDDGRFVAFESAADNLVPGDTNQAYDVFLHDTQMGGHTSRVSVASDGTQGSWVYGGAEQAAISGNGRYVAFRSFFSNLVTSDTNNHPDIFRYKREASLHINYPNGAPGSYFTLTGHGFPASDTATISANGHELGSIPVDANGDFTFLFSTTNADEGIYMITASVNPSATTQLILDAAEPIRPQEGTGSIIDIPVGIAFTNQVFLPLLQR
ncbi:MAG: calcium-binding protein [Chloroflexi bacterium]|nr:calcium-binding protein [Chloroflexota bacterium]